MKKLLAMAIILFSIDVVADSDIKYQFDLNSNQINHGWYTNDIDEAKYLNTMTGVGVSAFHYSGFGLRLGYMKGDEAQTTGRYKTYIVDMKHIISFEAIYKKEVLNNVELFAGFGTYLIPLPITSEEEGYYRNDSDDDEGYFYGVSLRLYKDFLINYRYTKYSTVRSNGSDEWTKGNSVQLVYEL